MHQPPSLAELNQAVTALVAANPGDWRTDAALRHLLERATVDLVPGFDEHARRCRFIAGARGASRLAEREIFLRERTSSGVFVSMSSPSGHERQRALEQIRSVPAAFCLGLVIYRFNDWVPEVRVAAARALARLEPGLSRGMAADCFRLYARSADWGRLEDAGRQALAALFGATAARGDVLQTVANARNNSAPMTLRWMLRTSDWDQHLPMLADQAKHPGVRLIALRALLEGHHAWYHHGRQVRQIAAAYDREALIRSGLEARSGVARLIALRAFAETIDKRGDAREVLRAMILDRAIGVASAAAFWLARAGEAPAEVIRSRLGQGDALEPATLALLAQVGTPDDARLLVSAAGKDASRRRAAALTAAAKLRSREAVDQLLDMTSGEDEAAAKAAVAALASLREPMGHGDLIRLAASPKRFLDRRLMLLTRGYKAWDQLEVLLTLIEHGAQPAQLEGWCQRLTLQARRFWQPSRPDVHRLGGQLRRLDGRLPPQLDELAWLVRRDN